MRDAGIALTDGTAGCKYRRMITRHANFANYFTLSP
jgi:hypothetical protein